MSFVDHLILAGPDLADLTSWLASKTGISATPGGRHLEHGTHNALAGLGDSTYLELMSPDPDGVADGRYRRSIEHITSPELFTWCARSKDGATLAARAAALGLEVYSSEGSRKTANGAELRWLLLVLAGHGFGGQVPFFIDWLDTPHPAAGLSAQATLTSLALGHPDDGGLSNLMTALGWDLSSGPVSVEWAAGPRLTATLATSASASLLTGAGSALMLS